jgi:hypothetical protein
VAMSAAAMERAMVLAVVMVGLSCGV